MKVKDLINKLQQYPENSEVWTQLYEDDQYGGDSYNVKLKSVEHIDLLNVVVLSSEDDTQTYDESEYMNTNYERENKE